MQDYSTANAASGGDHIFSGIRTGVAWLSVAPAAQRRAGMRAVLSMARTMRAGIGTA